MASSKFKKNVISSFVLSGTLLFSLVLSIGMGRNILHEIGQATPNDYELHFSSSENTFDPSVHVQEINTASGNPIMFSYFGYSEANDNWGNLIAGGYISNGTEINGLESLSIVYGETTSDLTVSFGWWDDEADLVVYEANDGLISSTSTEYDFNGYGPSFFKIETSQDVQIKSMTLKYRCDKTVNPFPAFNMLSFTQYDDSYSITGCNQSVVSITIPSYYEGLPVTSIGYSAFTACFSLTSITIPDSITSIEMNAFSGCSSLPSIDIPNSVTSIGDYAFNQCTSLTSIDIPSSVTSIGNFAFYGCSSLASIDIPSSVNSIGFGIFMSSALVSITIPDSITSIPSGMFSSCSYLVSVDIPSSVTSIGEDAFADCYSLSSFTISSSITSVEINAFANCFTLQSIEVDNDNENFASYAGAVYDKNLEVLICFPAGLSVVDLPSTVTTIKSHAFARCDALTSIDIPESVTTIENGAFYGCPSLTEVTIPNSVTTIENNLFSGCYSLTSVDIPNSVTSIGDSAFSYCASLTSIDIPNSVTSIGYEAFASCESLSSITIPDSLTNIAYGTFAYCYSLEYIIIPNSVTSIEDDAFSDSLPINNSPIYFKGTSEEWSAINFSYFEDNDCGVAYYSETEPSNDGNSYWHYDSDNVTPLLWDID